MSLLLQGAETASAEGRLYTARAIVTAPVIFSTAAGTGGPLLWNPGATIAAPNKTAVRLRKLGYSITTAATVAGSIGLTGGYQGATAPSATTAIDGATTNLMLGSTNPSQVNVYRVGTVANAGGFFIPLVDVSTTALTALGDNMSWLDLDGVATVLPGYWVAIAGSATLSTAALQIALVWEEIGQP